MIYLDFPVRRRSARLMLCRPFGTALACAALLAAMPAHAAASAEAAIAVPWLAQPEMDRRALVPSADLFGGDASLIAELFAQASGSRFQTDRRGREISDQEHAKDRRDRGQNKSFDELFQRARMVGRGEYIGVEPDISNNIYRFKFMRTSGKVVWVDMDGQSGRVVAERD